MNLDGTPRVSRETRRLFSAAGLAILALWILARLRFPDAPAPNPVAPVLTQISARAAFSELAEEAETARQRIAASMVAVTLPRDESEAADTTLAWPLQPDTALAVIPPSASRAPDVTAFDPVTGLAVVRASAGVPPQRIWKPERLDTPRYVFSARSDGGRLQVLPVYLDGLDSTGSLGWSADVWKTAAALRPGDFVFQVNGDWIGLASLEDGRPILVPAAVVLDRARALPDSRRGAPGDLGIEIQTLTPALAAATRSWGGVVVTHVDPSGPARELAAGDVIERLNGERIDSPYAWRVQTARLPADAPSILGVRRHGEIVDMSVVPRESETTAGGNQTPPLELGLTLTPVRGAGSRVVRVAPRSAAERAGLKPGDVITRAGDRPVPGPAQIRRLFDAAGGSDAIVLAITRDSSHLVVALSR